MRLAARLPELDLPTIHFIRLFSRFDFAAKRSGWIGGGADLTIDWAKVGGAYTSAFFAHVDGAGNASASYLILEPPRKLVDGGAKGVVFPRPSRPKLTTSAELFKAVAQARNNLLHGEKPHIDDRSVRLIGGGVFVLEEAVFWAETHKLPLAQHFDYSQVGRA